MEPKLWSKTFILLIAFELFAQVGANLINPVVSNYAVWMGASYAVAGFLAGINAFVSFAVRPFAGSVLRRFVRKKILVGAAIAFALSGLLCTFVVAIPALGIQRVIFGAAFVFKSALLIAFAGSIVPKDKLGQGVGYIGLANTIGAAIGPSIASYITNTMGYPFNCGVAVVFFAIAIVVILNVKDPLEDTQRESIRELKEANSHKTKLEVLKSEVNPRNMFHLKTIPLGITFVFEAFCYGTVLMFVLLVSEERGSTGGAFFFAIYVIACLITRPAAAKLYDKYGLRKLFLPEGILMTATFVVLAYADSVPAFAAAAILFALGQGSLYPSSQSEGVRGRSTQESPIAVNTLYIGADIGMFIGPFISGVILEISSSEVMMWANAVVCVGYVISLALYTRWRAKDDAREQEASAAANAASGD